MKKLRRNKKGYYTIRKEPYVSVTTFLRVIAKGFLLGWYARMEQDLVKRVVAKGRKKGMSDAEIIKKIIYFVSKKSTAADRYVWKRSKAGNILHKAIQAYLDTGKKTRIENPTTRKAFNNFLEWWAKGEYKALGQEQMVHDKDKKTAGTLDVYLERVKDGKRLIGDWKTGKYVYPDHHLQNIVYRYLGRKSHPSVGGLLIHVPQDGGPVKVHKADQKKYPLSMAWHALDLWRDVYEARA